MNMSSDGDGCSLMVPGTAACEKHSGRQVIVGIIKVRLAAALLGTTIRGRIMEYIGMLTQ